MRVQIIVDNGDRASFGLTQKEILVLNEEVKMMREYYAENEISGDYNIADELRWEIKKYLDALLRKVETPAVAAAGESKSNK